MWTRDKIATAIVDQAWKKQVNETPIYRVTVEIRNTKMALRKQNKNSFGELPKSIADLKQQIQVL